MSTLAQVVAALDPALRKYAVASPNGDPEGSFLRGVAGVAADDVWAVGYTVHHDEETATPSPTPLAQAHREPEQREHPNHGFEALLLHWDGTAWTHEEGPELPEQHFLRAVTAVASDDIWAVGYSGDSVPHTLVEHWDGTEWSTVPSPKLSWVTRSPWTAVVGSPTRVAAVPSGKYRRPAPRTTGTRSMATSCSRPRSRHWPAIVPAATPTVALPAIS